MKKLLSSFLVISFILWILPLGVFINPSQEKLACDGQRAICMCHAMVPKSSDKAMAGIALKAGSSTNKENSSGGSGGSYFISAKPTVALNLQPVSLFENQHFCYNNPFLAALEYVPKI